MMKSKHWIASLAIMAACNTPQTPVEQTTDSNATPTVAAPTNERVEKLLQSLSMNEKIAQMTQLNITSFMTDESKAKFNDVYPIEIDTNKAISLFKSYPLGSILNGKAVSPENWASAIRTLQEIHLRYSKVPFIFGIDHVHGTNYLSGGTVFPQEINLAATFNPALAAKAGEITALECALVGHQWNFAPILDLGRNKFWPRLYETFGEDPHLGAVMGAAYTKALQEAPAKPTKVAACAKHFLGYSDPKSGWDRSPAEIAPQTLQEMFRPAFQAAVDAGIKTFMINSGEINGVPVHASKEILTDLLRKEMGFKGLVVTDWEDIKNLAKGHKIAANEKEATLLAIQAGIDMSMVPYDTSFIKYMKELVAEGKISEERINESVRRILMLKSDLGILDNPYPATDFSSIGKEENQQASFQAALESIVLIKNDKNTLPLQNPKKIVVAGMNSNIKRSICGGWSYRWIPDKEDYFPENMPTVYQALQTEFKNTKVELATSKDLSAKSKGADAIIIATGELPYAEGFGSITDLDLDKNEVALIQQAIATKKPVILLLIEGRPRTIPTVFDGCSAVVFAGLPGTHGATAIAQLLSGKENFSGKMSITYPFKQGHIITYNHKPTDFSYLHRLNDDRIRWTIAEFGTGLSYTQFEYENLTLSDTVVTKEGSIKATVTVKNTGKMDGKESVLWFLTDEVRSITPPVKALKHFEKKTIKAGESETFTFEIKPNEHLSFPDEKGKKLLESGYFTLRVGNQTARFLMK